MRPWLQTLASHIHRKLSHPQLSAEQGAGPKRDGTRQGRRAQEQWVARLTIGSGRVPLTLLSTDEHGEGRVGDMEALAWKRGPWPVSGQRHRNPGACPCPCPGPRIPRKGTHTHRDQCLKEAIENQVPKGLAPREVRHEPDEEVGDHGQGCGEDDPEEGEV